VHSFKITLKNRQFAETELIKSVNISKIRKKSTFLHPTKPPHFERHLFINTGKKATGIYSSILEKKQQGKKSFAVLIDPDKVNEQSLDALIELAKEARVDYFFVGGSLVVSDNMDECIQQIKSSCAIPVILFPGSPSQVSKYADALLYLSLISGRNLSH